MPLFWRVLATGPAGASSYTTGTPFTSPNPPSVPVLVAPASGAALNTYTPTFDWTDSTGSLDHYQLQISTSATFASLTVDQNNLLLSFFTPSPPLLPSPLYYWRVRAIGPAGAYSLWTVPRSFKAP
jgi:hypothetical protein